MLVLSRRNKQKELLYQADVIVSFSRRVTLLLNSSILQQAISKVG